jgi:TPR repeat protein
MTSGTALADESTRRAFVVGIERYGDGDIQGLNRANTDARDIGRDLEEIGFDKKNITVATDVPTKADFNKRFDAFLKTVNEGDFVFFYFSGHGLGVDSTSTNYLLLGDLKSPVTFTRNKLPVDERRDRSVIRARAPEFMDQYEAEEVPRAGISVTEIQDRLREKKPATAFLILDACRTIVRSEANEARIMRRGNASGSRLVANRKPPDGFLLLYSAAFGEQAVESFDGNDRRRNSLFTEVLRSEMMRPGQSLIDLAERVRLVVNALAGQRGRQQEPEFYPTSGGPEDIFLVNGIGETRFGMAEAKCRGADEDWDRIAVAPKRDAIDRHIRRFDSCRTVERARRALVNLSDSSEEPPLAPSLPTNRPVDPCDQLAASDTDRARPPEVPGVTFNKIEPQVATAACKDSIAKNPRVVRYLFNLGRALMAQANTYNPRTQKQELNESYREERLAYEDAQQRGYVAAVYNLGVMYDLGLGIDADQERANDLFKRAAQQGFPLAMYTLALRYRSGTKGIPRDDTQAYEWFAKASESGLTEATVEVGEALWYGKGVQSGRNPRRAIDALQRASEAGSNQAKYLLGLHYFYGSNSGDDDPNGVREDNALALIWLGRAAEVNDANAQYVLAMIMEGGWGLPSPQPEIAERYWRFAAYGGNENAQVEFADRLKSGRVLAKPENGAREGMQLWERAFSQGSARAALELARLYRAGDANAARNPLLAMKYAYQAIALATRVNPLTTDGNPFYEIAAGILLAEMARNDEAVDASGNQLLSKDEVERLERFYGRVDPATKEVKVRRLQVKLTCFRYRTGRNEYARQTARPYYFWVWDWGRVESPTEPQFRNLEYSTGCSDNKDLRDTLSASFQLSQKSKVAFADLIDQQIKVAAGAETTEPRRRRR